MSYQLFCFVCLEGLYFLPMDGVLFEIVRYEDRRPLGLFHDESNPQPGSFIEVDRKIYVILERRHRYQLKMSRYVLERITLYVQATETPFDKTWVEGRWVIGNIDCKYNARSVLIRCAVNPAGPCDRCPNFQPLSTAPI